MQEDVSKSAGFEHILNQYKDLIKDVSVSTLRQIVKFTSNIITHKEREHTNQPSEEELEKLFKYVPNLLDSNTGSLDVSTNIIPVSTSHKVIENHDDFMNELHLELSSLGLENRSSKRVSTQWVLCEPESVNLPSVLPMGKFKCIPKLCELVNQQEECKGQMNGCLVNYYPSKCSRSNPHSDKESYIDQEASICTFSLGQTRDFSIFTNDHNPKHLKTFTLCEKSLMLMQPGSHSVTKHKVMESFSDDSSRWSISFRHIIPSKNITNEWPYSDHKINNANDHVSNSNDTNGCTLTNNLSVDVSTIILGTSITHGLIPSKLSGKSGKTIINLSQRGEKIDDLSKVIDDFYVGKHSCYDTLPSNAHMNIKNIFICVGTNDIRHAEHGINHLFSPLMDLLQKVKNYYPLAKIIVQSSLPQIIENKFTVKNVLSLNKLLFKVCAAQRIFYMDVFKYFLLPNFYPNKQLYWDNVHLNKKGLGVLARAYIQLIRGRYNPLII